ncbi:MAG: formylglycine-generating enzyme family protein [Deltaproteobacteria bacterium]|nr:formylglycine-generating enzyme family protein [Deltaproteobacteria bacterium]
MRPAPALPAVLLAAALAACGGQAVPAPERPPAPAARTPAAAAAPAQPAPAARTAAAPSAEADAGSKPPASAEGCDAPPLGMTCIPAGPGVVGDDALGPSARPRHVVEISTFYLDRAEVTNGQYEACVRAGRCPARGRLDAALAGPEQPAMGLSWEAAHDCCLWAGKRLPTEAEWEKAARGGNEQGLHDMGGSALEWVQDWWSDCYSGCGLGCGAGCTGRDPQGPCAGGPQCGSRSGRTLKGGSWRSPPEQARAAWRGSGLAVGLAPAAGVRCAASTPFLALWPPLQLSEAPPSPPVPEPPAPADLALFGDVPEDDDVLKIPNCHRIGDASLTCRDPHSYLVSNEPRQQLWQPFIANLGGGYVGIGADQDYSLIAVARSSWAWIFDYDPAVVRLHYVLRAIVLRAPTPRDFLAALAPEHAKETRAWVQRSLDADIAGGRLPEAERPATDLVYQWVGGPLRIIYARSAAPDPAAGGFGWLRVPEHYGYVRTMYEQGRICLRKGNLLTDRALPAIARAARRLGVVVRVLYTSNADDQWTLTRQYRDNLAALPFDRQSVVIRTIYPRNKPGRKVAPWDYTVHDGLDLQRRVVHEGWTWMHWFGAEGRRGEPSDLVTIALPARTPREPARGRGAAPPR